MAGNQSIGIQINQQQLQSVQALLRDIQNGAEKAMKLAINKTLQTTKVQITKKLGEKLDTKASIIKKDIQPDKASITKASGSIVVRGKPQPLINYKTGEQLRKGVKARVFKSSPNRMIYGAFYAQMRSGHVGLFLRKHDLRHRQGQFENAAAFNPALRRRVGIRWMFTNENKKYRLPIKELLGPRIEDILAKPDILTPIERDGADLFANNVDSAIMEIIRRNNENLARAGF